MSDLREEKEDKAESGEDYVPQGAACQEIVAGQNIASTTPNHNVSVSDIEEIAHFPQPHQNYQNFQTMLPDPSNSPRRFSTFLTPNDAYSYQQYRRNHRLTSLPSLSANNEHHFNHDLDLKKLMLDSSRRSSLESAYHSQRSDPASRTQTSSRLEFVDDSNNFSDDLYYLTSHSFANDENLERSITERRNSLSYEAVRAYFLERNPYLHDHDHHGHFLAHGQGNSTCLSCNRRRSSVLFANTLFRTHAHQAVIERQFEDLSNIPEPNRSRSTSIDIFGGIPFLNQEDLDRLNNSRGIDNTSTEKEIKQDDSEEDKCQDHPDNM